VVPAVTNWGMRDIASALAAAVKGTKPSDVTELNLDQKFRADSLKVRQRALRSHRWALVTTCVSRGGYLLEPLSVLRYLQSCSVCAPFLQGLESYVNLESLSVSAVGLTSLEGLPSSASLLRLRASDNKLSGGLDVLVSCCPNLRKLDLTNNRMATVDALRPLSALSGLHSLEVEANPLALKPDYRQEIFKIIPSLTSLDQQDVYGQGAGRTRGALPVPSTWTWTWRLLTLSVELCRNSRGRGRGR
jgi:hypothetical protein